MANFDLMLSHVTPPPTPEIKPQKRPSFGKVEQGDGSVDPMLSNRVIEEPASRSFEQQKRPRFNGDMDWAQGTKLYRTFGLAADQRQKPKFNLPAD